jgi:hypothetical protein
MASHPQPHASTSKLPANPQLGPDPYFSYPTPTPEQIDEELPPYWEGENVPLGAILDRMTRRGYGDMRVLLEKTYVLPLGRRWIGLIFPDCHLSMPSNGRNISSSMPKRPDKLFSNTLPSSAGKPRWTLRPLRRASLLLLGQHPFLRPSPMTIQPLPVQQLVSGKARARWWMSKEEAR